MSKKTITFWQYGNTKNYTVSLITSFLFVSHLTVSQSWLIWCALKEYLMNTADIWTVTVVIEGIYCSENRQCFN